MMDALVPAVGALCAAASAGKTMPDAWTTRRGAAQAGAQSTPVTVAANMGAPNIWAKRRWGIRMRERLSIALLFADSARLGESKGDIGNGRIVTTLQDGKNYYLDTPQQASPSLLKGSNSLDWGMKNRLARIFDPDSGQTVMLAVDHGYFQGPTTGLERIDITIVPLVPYADALMITRGALRSSIPPEMSKPVVLRSSGGQSILKELSNELVAVDIEDAVRLNASAWRCRFTLAACTSTSRSATW